MSKKKPISDYTDSELRTTLTDKQLHFIEAYLFNGFNGVKAALKVYATGDYSTAGSISVENLQKPAISEYIHRRLDEKAMQSNEVLARLTEIARGNMGDFLEINDSGQIEISLKKARAAGLTHLVKKVKQKKRVEKKDGEKTVYVDTSLELYSAADALDKLARVHGLYDDSMSLKVEGTVGVLKTDSPPDADEWVAMMKEHRQKLNGFENESNGAAPD